MSKASKEEDDDDEFYADLPDDAGAEEAAAEERALLTSLETRRRNGAARHFMDAEMRVAEAHRRNIEAARAAVAEARHRRESEYPLPSYQP
jgi:hypothetical protein